MSKFHSDSLDECCENIKGHENWSYFYGLTKLEQKRALAGKATTIVFWDDDDREGTNG